MSSLLRLTTADLVVLSVFLYGRTMHGYELVKKLDQSDFEDWAPISRPQIYYSLGKLANAGYLVPSEDCSAAKGPKRVVYKASAKALAAMRESLNDLKWVEQRPPPPFLTWMALALHAEVATIEKQIKRRKIFLQTQIKREVETLASFGENDEPSIAVAQVMINYMLKQFRDELDMLDDLKVVLLKRK